MSALFMQQDRSQFVMWLRRWQPVVAMMAATTVCSCSQSDAPSVPNDRVTKSNRIELTEEEFLASEKTLYVQCEEDEATTILEIRVTIPNVADEYPIRVPLCLRRTLNGGFTRLTAFVADGAPVDDRGFVQGGHFGIDDATETSVDVSLSLDWTAPDCSRGSLDELLLVTVGKPSVKELEGNITIRWAFQDPSLRDRR